MTFIVPFLKEAFPSHLLVNMDYRLATWSSPGYPKQIEDLQVLIQYITKTLLGSRLKSERDPASLKFVLLGGSAGAHLAMLYGYKYNDKGYVKAVVDVVGPVDLTDPSYVLNPIYNYIAFSGWTEVVSAGSKSVP